MTDDTEAADMFFAAQYGRHPSTTPQGRREREARILTREERMSVHSASTRTRQLNLKVTPETYEAFASRARARRMSMPDFLEHLLQVDQGTR